MKILRTVAIILPQSITLLILGARFDVIFGFNRTDAGLSTLLLLLVLAPVITLSWFIVETVRSIRLANRLHRPVSFLLPGLALLFFIEALAIDIYMVLSFKM